MMKKKLFFILTLLCLTVQGICAQTAVTTEKQLTDAIADGATNIQLAENIQLSKYLDIDGVTVTIDLNGHKLSRNLSDYDRAGHVIWAHNGSNLTLTSGVAGGSIEGGMAYNGGAIHIPNGNTVSAENIIFRNNSALEHAGAIWNNGTFTATNCTFTDNTASDVGAIYNSVTEDGEGTATLTGCTFTGNAGTAGAGALANAMGNTVMTINGGTIKNNTAGSNGGGIWNGGTLNMKGAITVQDNTNGSGVVSNVYLKSGKVITVIGSLDGSDIGVDMESVTGMFTSGFGDYVHTSAYIFTADRSSIVSVIRYDNEIYLDCWNSDPVTYIERSWDDTNKKVVSTEKGLTTLIACDATPVEGRGEFKEVTNAPADAPDEWFGMGDSNSSVAEYYVVRGDVMRQTIVVQGKDVHLILCNGATLTLTGGLKLEGDNKLYIHSQSYGGDMGRLMVTNSYKYAAGIGSARHDNKTVKVGELVIFGGHIEATGGEYGAGIGSCAKIKTEEESRLCNKVTVYGGFVKAQGGDCAAGIGGGCNRSEDKGLGIDGGDFILYDGTVIANSGYTTSSSYFSFLGAAGVGGGGSNNGYGGYGGNVTIYGGTLTAISDHGAAGIGSAKLEADNNDKHLSRGGTFTIYGGTVTAKGYDRGAGIGGGESSGGAIVSVYGGTVTAKGGKNAAGIGGGDSGDGGTVTITGGTVTAKGGEHAAGIGGGDYGDGGTVTITGGTVTATGGRGAAGIGGGYNDEGGTVTITGGIVIAKAGIQGGKVNRAIGPGNRNDKYGTLTIGNAMMVGAGNNGSVESIFDADERLYGCWFHSYAELSPCSHPSGFTYTINEDGTHTSHCKHCSLSEKTEHFNSDGSGTCICGYKDGEGYCTITIATSSDGTSYEGVGMTVNVGNNKPYTLPECTTIPEGYDFAGWVVSPQSQDNGIRPNEGETLLAANSEYIVTSHVSIFARYKNLDIILADDGDNAEKLYTYNGKKAASVILEGRTLTKDGTWNTLCLPFSLDSFVGTPLEGATVKTLGSASFNNGTLTLDFEDASEMVAGTPYIVKWEGQSSGDVMNPVFEGVTIVNTSNPITSGTTEGDEDGGCITFVGTYSQLGFSNDDKGILFFGTNNKLYNPLDGVSDEDDSTCTYIGAFRAFFQLADGINADDPDAENGIKRIVLNFGSVATGISLTSSPSPLTSGTWYTLDGRKLRGMPTQRGIYVSNGKRIIIK